MGLGHLEVSKGKSLSRGIDALQSPTTRGPVSGVVGETNGTEDAFLKFYSLVPMAAAVGQREHP